MQKQCCCFLLSYMALAIPFSLAFNIDIRNPDVYSGEQKDFFGYKVIQFMSGTSKGIIVTAPLQLNGSGGVCRPRKNQSAECFNSQGLPLENQTVPVTNLGLSIAVDSTRSQFTVCSPHVGHECYKNSYLNSVCYKMTDPLQHMSSFTPAFQECTKRTVDLVFLFDGSLSMTNDEFSKNKAFILDIMDHLAVTSIKFAAVQFSTEYRKVFDFNDYVNGTALDKLKKEAHMQSLTNTHRALKYVLENILESPEAGASPDATKVLVLITDGQPSDKISVPIIEKYNVKNILRFVIAVKDAKLDKFEHIASKPTSKYAFKIEDYNGLTGILEEFQINIFKMEGSTVALGGDMTNEMSQSGFSAVYYNDTLILGSVGSKTWRGSLQQLHVQKETTIEDAQMLNDSYMGYSVSVGEVDKTPLYFAGAPRFGHIGQVVLFKQEGKNWAPSQRLNGDQIGSYFGAELCSLDINSDGNTDFLLVGAPLFYQSKERREGQVSVYSMTEEMRLKSELNVSVPSMGRFGTTISGIADLNGDGLKDVAVGAPLEDDNTGAVYIYLGDQNRGIRGNFSQRLAGRGITPGLRFFGQAIDGHMDLGEDGLPDVVIGSQGAAVVLRSRPVFDVMARLSFVPREISTDDFDCVDKKDQILPMVNLTACFEVVEATKSKAGAIGSGFNVSYMLNVDPLRQTYRGFFGLDKKARNFTSTYMLRDKTTCLSFPIYMPKCVKDTLTPVSVKLSFSQADRESASAVLNVDSVSQAVVEVPFEKQCAKNDTCIADLEVDFNFRTPTLLVAEDNYFNVSVKLTNHGDDSYNTSLTIYYPPGLSFSRMTLTEATRPTLHSCHDLDEVLDKTICSISLPVYRSRSAATFKMSFYVMTNYEWNDTVSMTISGISDNTNITRNNSRIKSVPVQFEIKMAVTVREGSTTYLNFTKEDDAPKKVYIVYKIANPGLKEYPVDVSLLLPTNLAHNLEMKNYQVSVQQNKTRCNVTDIRAERCSPETHRKIIACDTFLLDKESITEVTLSGDVQFRDLKKHVENIAFLKHFTGDSEEVKFKTSVRVNYDRQRYVLDFHEEQNVKGFSQKSFHETGRWNDCGPTLATTEVRVEFILDPNRLLIILTGVGVGLLLLIIVTVIMFKLGCFKSKKYYQEGEETVLEDDIPNGSTANMMGGQSETQDKPDQPAEKEKLLADKEANGSSPRAVN